MPKIIYVEHDGTTHAMEVPVGTSLMKGATRNNVPGIVGECGGVMDCATCHVYVDESWADKVPAAGPVERGMLPFAPGSDHTSRLACQIVCAESLDGMVVRLPASQG